LIGDEIYNGDKLDEDRNYRFCSCFNIHKKLSGHIRKRLEQDGITKGFIYPTAELSTWSVYEKSKSKLNK